MATFFHRMPKSGVEQTFLKRSGRKFIYPPEEKIPVIEVKNFPLLGKFIALRFLEWVQQNPEGVISLPTGKTPEHFIKWTTHYLSNWTKPEVQTDLEMNGIDPAKKPEMSKLRFVQIDEFYPIDPNQRNSFYHYVDKFYIEQFGLDIKKALLINCWQLGVPENMTLDKVFPDWKVDLGLRTKQPKRRYETLQKKVIEEVDRFCMRYETKIREMGGIGFFLGGIGPDGHIAFNVRGADHFSTTRLTETNYETQAAAAQDLGGLEVSRNRLVITIGLSTVTYNRDCVAIILAAGEAKATIVAQAVQQEKDNLYPATVFQELPNARFYLTQGATKLLVERAFEDFLGTEELTAEQTEKAVIDHASSCNKPIQRLTTDELNKSRFTQLILKKTGKNLRTMVDDVQSSLVQKINLGVAPVENKVFMHTAPHHDDIMLGYLPYIYHLVRSPLNTHYFNYMTSGFTAVTNNYVHDLLAILLNYIDTDTFKQLLKENYFYATNEVGYNRDVYQYLDGIAAHSRTMKEEALARRLLRIIILLFEEESISHLKDRIRESMSYLSTQYPGKKDVAYIQQLKGMIREWEADLLWGYFGFNSRSVNHLRLGFYKGDIFTEEPEIHRDVMPVLNLLKSINPDVVTVALDPESSGPDTHYKVMQAISEALKIHQKEFDRNDIEIWGYRNVWYRFHPSESNIFIPVSLNTMAILESAFINCFGSQKDASFPSYELDGPFSRLAQRVFAEQYQAMKVCLSRAFFYENQHPRLRACRGLCFLKKMTMDEFFERSLELRKKIEA
jgi:glucosamine-6-phosphate deaminase